MREQAEQIKNFKVEGTNNNELEKCKKKERATTSTYQTGRMTDMKDSGQYVSQVQWKQNPATLRTQRKCQTATHNVQLCLRLGMQLGLHR